MARTILLTGMALEGSIAPFCQMESFNWFIPGPLPSGMSLSPGGHLFVAQRRSGKIFALTPEGKRVEFASFTGRSALRTLAFPPVTRETQKAGIAGDLFVMVFPVLDYPVREVVRISGPFDAYVKGASSSR